MAVVVASLWMKMTGNIERTLLAEVQTKTFRSRGFGLVESSGGFNRSFKSRPLVTVDFLGSVGAQSMTQCFASGIADR